MGGGKKAQPFLPPGIRTEPSGLQRPIIPEGGRGPGLRPWAEKKGGGRKRKKGKEHIRRVFDRMGNTRLKMTWDERFANGCDD